MRSYAGLVWLPFCVATLAGVFSSIQYGGGLIVLGVWLLFAAWLWRALRHDESRESPMPTADSPVT